MGAPLKTVIFILLLTYDGLVSCGFTYDDQYEEIDKDNYGFDLSELRHIEAEHPKYNTMIKGYSGRKKPEAVETLAKTGDPCDVTKYQTYLHPIHKLKTSASADNHRIEIVNLTETFAEARQSGAFNWTEVCFHTVNSLYCKAGICECLEVPENDYYGLKQGQDVTYDQLSFTHYKFCEIQENYGCDPLKDIPSCDRSKKLICGNIGVCIKSSSSVKSCNIWRIILFIFTYKVLYL